MVIVILAWLSIFFIFFSFGNFLISLFNKITKRNEQYNITDTFILGMCFSLIPLSITSLWLPSNHYIMFAYIGLSIVYWVVRKEHFKSLFAEIKNTIANCSLCQLTLLLVPFVILLICALWQSYSSDAAGYHYQLTHWNELCGVTPGIANLEDRIGFNSNYSLISAIFTFRFLTGDQHFLIQSLLAALVINQIIWEAIKSKFDIRYIILLFLFFFYCWGNYYNLNNSSTDILPALCLFYLLSKYILTPQLFENQKLLVCFLPITLITIKLSVVPILLLSFYCLYLTLKNKEWNTAILLTMLGILIIVPWLIRNVVISGYLVYPVYQIDLFSFDWKLPKYVAVMQSNWIHDYPRIALANTVKFFNEFIANGGIASEKSRFTTTIVQIVVCIFLLSSPFVIGYNYLKNKKKREDHLFYVLYLVMTVYIIYCATTAPDFRFMAGVAYVILFLEICILFRLNSRIKCLRMSKGYASIVTFLLLFLLIIGKELYNGYKVVQEDICGKSRPFSTIVYAPYTSQSRAKLDFDTYQMGNITIYISTITPWFPYDIIPGTGAPSQFKYQPIEEVEARGSKLSDGFRPKPIN